RELPGPGCGLAAQPCAKTEAAQLALQGAVRMHPPPPEEGRQMPLYAVYADPGNPFRPRAGLTRARSAGEGRTAPRRRFGLVSTPPAAGIPGRATAAGDRPLQTRSPAAVGRQGGSVYRAGGIGSPDFSAPGATCS